MSQSDDLYEQARYAYEEIRENDPETWEELKIFAKEMEGTLSDGDI